MNLAVEHRTARHDSINMLGLYTGRDTGQASHTLMDRRLTCLSDCQKNVYDQNTQRLPVLFIRMGLTIIRAWVKSGRSDLLIWILNRISYTVFMTFREMVFAWQIYGRTTFGQSVR